MLDPASQVVAQATGEVSVVDARPLGGSWALNELWRRLGIGQAIGRAARGRRIDPAVERVLFALVANRALDPLSKLAAGRWVSERVFVEGLPGLDPQPAYRAMDFLLDALPEPPEAGLLPGGRPAQPGGRPAVLRHHLHLLRDRRAGRVSPSGPLQRPPARPPPGRDRHGRDPPGDPGAGLVLPGQQQRSGAGPPRQGGPRRLVLEPGGLGRRPRLRLGGEPPLPPARRQPLHHGREASWRERRGRGGPLASRPLPPRGRQPARQGGGDRRGRHARPLRHLPQPRPGSARRRRARGAPGPAAERRSKAPTGSARPSATPSSAASRPSRATSASCARPPAASSASTGPRSGPRRAWTASTCFAPPTAPSRPRTSPSATRRSSRPNAAGAT